MFSSDDMRKTDASILFESPKNRDRLFSFSGSRKISAQDNDEETDFILNHETILKCYTKFYMSVYEGQIQRDLRFFEKVL